MHWEALAKKPEPSSWQGVSQQFLAWRAPSTVEMEYRRVGVQQSAPQTTAGEENT